MSPSLHVPLNPTRSQGPWPQLGHKSHSDSGTPARGGDRGSFHAGGRLQGEFPPHRLLELLPQAPEALRHPDGLVLDDLFGVDADGTFAKLATTAAVVASGPSRANQATMPAVKVGHDGPAVPRHDAHLGRET